MKMFKHVVAALACSLAFGSANAALITVDQEFDLNPDHKVVKDSPAGFSFNLNALLAGYGVISTNIVSAYLEVFMTDPGTGQNQEKYLISVSDGAGLQTQGGHGNNQVPNGNNEAVVTVVLSNALAGLQANGLLTGKVALDGNAGDFYVTRAKLFASFEEPMNDVPEPASLALLGMGLVGLAGARRRRA